MPHQLPWTAFAALLLLGSLAQATVPIVMPAVRQESKHAKSYFLLKMENEKEPRRVAVPPGTDVVEAVQKAAGRRGVVYAEPDPIVYTAATTNDPIAQWHLPQIKAREAWDATTGAASVRICVADTGVNFDHPDLKDNIARVNGVPVGMTYGSTNYPNRPGMDDNGHGSVCAGLAGAAANNSLGVAGVNWNVSIISCKFIGPKSTGVLSDAAKCVRWCVDNGASVISASFGVGNIGSSSTMESVLQYALDSGVLYVASAGNSNSSTPNYPAAYSRKFPNVVAVAATGANDTWAPFSNWGPWVQLAAPGVGVISTWTGTVYASRSGTSMAASMVAGAAALAMAARGGSRSIPPATLRDHLVASVDRVPVLEGRVSSGGRLNVAALLQLAKL